LKRFKLLQQLHGLKEVANLFLI